MSPQDAMLHLKQSMQHNGAAAAAAAAAASANAAVAAAADPFKAHDGPFPKGRIDSAKMEVQFVFRKFAFDLFHWQ